MSDTVEFFEELARRGHDPLLERVHAAIRFDVVDDADDADGAAGDGDEESRTHTWLVTVDQGELSVSTDRRPADATITCTRSELDALVTGRSNAMASLLRGALTVEGDPELVVLAQRLFARPEVRTSGWGMAAAGEKEPS